MSSEGTIDLEEKLNENDPSSEETNIDSSLIDDDYDSNSLPDSDSTYNLADDITPPSITPREGSEPDSDDLEEVSSDVSEEIIPKFLFMQPSTTRSLNIEFNRCLLLDFDSIPPYLRYWEPEVEVIRTTRSCGSDKSDCSVYSRKAMSEPTYRTCNLLQDDDDDSSRYDCHLPAINICTVPIDTDLSLSLDSDRDSQETERDITKLSTYRSISSNDYATEEENLQLSRCIEDEWSYEECDNKSYVDEAELLWIEKQFWVPQEKFDRILGITDSSECSENSTISSNSASFPDDEIIPIYLFSEI